RRRAACLSHARVRALATCEDRRRLRGAAALERAGCGTRVNAPRISIDHLTAAVKKIEAMTLEEKAALIDEIHEQQPALLASCLVQPRLGVTLEKLEFLLHILMVCFQAMKE